MAWIKYRHDSDTSNYIIAAWLRRGTTIQEYDNKDFDNIFQTIVPWDFLKMDYHLRNDIHEWIEDETDIDEYHILVHCDENLQNRYVSISFSKACDLASYKLRYHGDYNGLV